MKVGVAVTLTGLKTRGLNGQRGYISGPLHRPVEGVSRWPVQLMAPLQNERVIGVRPENMIAEPAADSLIERVLSDPDCLLCILAKLESAAELARAAAVARLWHEQSEEESVWTQLFERRFAPTVRATALPLSAEERVRRYDLADSRAAGSNWDHEAKTGDRLDDDDAHSQYATSPKAAFRHRSELPAADSADAFEFGSNVRRGADGTFVSEGDPRRWDSQPKLRAAAPLRPLVGSLGYFEMTGLNGSSVGLVRGPAYNPLQRTGHIGWRRTAYAFHSDDGTKWRQDASFSCGEHGEPYHPAGFGANATVGVGIDFDGGELFFTLNGKFLGVAFSDVDRGPLFPAAALHEPGDACRFNLGQQPFAFDLEAHHAALRGAEAK